MSIRRDPQHTGGSQLLGPDLEIGLIEAAEMPTLGRSIGNAPLARHARPWLFACQQPTISRARPAPYILGDAILRHFLVQIKLSISRSGRAFSASITFSRFISDGIKPLCTAQIYRHCSPNSRPWSDYAIMRGILEVLRVISGTQTSPR
ncbi:hypothetical protein RN629_16470 [Sphingomonadaceae bacterium jetA1]|jgi:hypothetical protein|uniref:hypothetical protein n=1 Tax=Facivitalis istanbulensis TaxID=3075838 RepID=UPI0034858BD8